MPRCVRSTVSVGYIPFHIWPHLRSPAAQSLRPAAGVEPDRDVDASYDRAASMVNERIGTKRGLTEYGRQAIAKAIGWERPAKIWIE